MYKRWRSGAVAFAATSASADHAVGRSGGGHSGRPSGGHPARAFLRWPFFRRPFLRGTRVLRQSSLAPSRRALFERRVTRGYSSEPLREQRWRARYYGGAGHAVPRGSFSQPPRTGAQYRHPRAATNRLFARPRIRLRVRSWLLVRPGTPPATAATATAATGTAAVYYSRYPYYYGTPPTTLGGLGLSFAFADTPTSAGTTRRTTTTAT